MGLEDIIADRKTTKSLGFGAVVKSNKKEERGALLKDLQANDIVKFGLIPEFVGRIPIHTTLHELDRDMLLQVLQQPKNALVGQYECLFEMDEAKLTFTEDALLAIADEAIEQNTGARGLRSILENVLMDAMYELPSIKPVHEVIIEKETVNDGKKPMYVVKPLKESDVSEKNEESN